MLVSPEYSLLIGRVMRKIILCIISLLFVGCASSPEEEFLIEDVDISIDIETTYQYIHHFGASAAWWAQAVGEWPEPVVNEMMDLLFDKEKGVGLNIIRYNVGGGKDGVIVSEQLRRVETLEVSPGVYDWTRDENSISIIDKAVEKGAEVILFYNSPPLRLTQTGSTTGRGKASNLKENSEKEYAEYIVGIAEYLRNVKGWPIHDISPINEPNNSWASGQEGCAYTPNQAYKVIKAVDSEIKKRDLDFKISAIDTGEMMLGTNAGYIKKLFNDPVLRESLDHFAVHSYWSTRYDREDLHRFMAKNYPEKEIWMTEWTEMVNGKDLSMDAGRALAQTVHEDFTFAGVSSWQYWIALSPYDYRDGLIYIDMASRDYEVAKKLWVLGNWSKFINSGALRVENTVDDSSLFVSSFKNVDDSVVLVMVNMAEDVEKKINISGDFGTKTMQVLYETSKNKDLEKIYSGELKSFIVPPNSVVTLVLQ